MPLLSPKQNGGARFPEQMPLAGLLRQHSSQHTGGKWVRMDGLHPRAKSGGSSTGRTSARAASSGMRMSWQLKLFMADGNGSANLADACRRHLHSFFFEGTMHEGTTSQEPSPGSPRPPSQQNVFEAKAHVLAGLARRGDENSS